MHRAITGHPPAAAREGSQFGNRPTVDRDGQTLPSFDPAKDLGSVIPQVSNGDVVGHDASVAHELRMAANAAPNVREMVCWHTYAARL